MKAHRRLFIQKMKKRYSWFSDDLFESAVAKSIRENVKKADLKIGELHEENEIINLIIFMVLNGANSIKISELIIDHISDKYIDFHELSEYEYSRVHALITNTCKEMVLSIISKKREIKNNMSITQFKNIYQSIVSNVTLLYLNIIEKLYK